MVRIELSVAKSIKSEMVNRANRPNTQNEFQIFDYYAYLCGLRLFTLTFYEPNIPVLIDCPETKTKDGRKENKTEKKGEKSNGGYNEPMVIL